MNKTKFKVKYLDFDPKVHRRPPYYGTWRKMSDTIKPNKPFAKDVLDSILILIIFYFIIEIFY